MKFDTFLDLKIDSRRKTSILSERISQKSSNLNNSENSLKIPNTLLSSSSIMPEI
jgi:hypothetical protein